MTPLVLGYYGFGNAGDEWLLVQTIRYAEKAFGDVNFLIPISSGACPKDYREKLGGRVGPSSPGFRGLNIFRRGSFWGGRAIFRADALLLGGGGLLQDRTSVLSILYYLFFMVVFLLRRRPVYCVGQGVGPLTHPVSRFLVRWVMQRVTFIEVRDDVSKGLLRQLGISSSRIHKRADLCFYGVTPSTKTRSFDPTAIGLSLRDNVMPDRVLMTLFSKLPHPKVHLSCHATQEHTVRNLSEAYGVPLVSQSIEDDFYTDNDYGVSTLISARYHACVWAALHGIPFIALGIDDKLIALATSLKQPFIALQSSLDMDQFETRLSFALKDLERHYSTYESALGHGVQQLASSIDPTTLSAAQGHLTP